MNTREKWKVSENHVDISMGQRNMIKMEMYNRILNSFLWKGLS